MARKPASGTRKRILDVAARLFGEHGVRAVGIQQVIDETGLGKSQLYREFDGKDDLVAAWLRDSDAAWWEVADAAVARHAEDPARQILAVIELVYDGARSPGFRGCPFYNTSTEFRDPGHPGRREAVTHLERLRERLLTLAGAAGATDPQGLSDALMLVIGGLYANGAALGPDGPVRQALTTAEALVRLHCPPR
ncbi:TetR/AcrR family transcriptional regulator [Microbispora sp. NPDC049125]|uniref:TetR/AcrR family transcriptional regulator n=1 Tax=Microbispora sp. NPDC049125 TaxID=3154929 RepID=UPI00346671D9